VRVVDAASVSLIVASLDLQLVRLIRGAMRVADMQGGGGTGGLPLASTVNRDIQPQPKLKQHQQIEPRPVFHPTPYFAPRPVIHPQPRVVNPPPVACAPVEPEKEPRSHCPIQPPWKLLPWQTPIPPRPVIKTVVHRTDVVNKGSLIDMFI
jgi:hypothetical protein